MSSVGPKNEDGFEVCVIRSIPAETSPPKAKILKRLRKCGFCNDAVFAIKLALEEALCNALNHGNCCDPNKKVTIRYLINAERAEFVVRDEGDGFEPETVPDPTTPDRLRLPTGRGIMLIKAYMDQVCYRDNGREVYFVKKRVGGKRNKRV